MFIVVEFNQASHMPRVCDDIVYLIQDEAEEVAQMWRGQLAASGSGRRERYAVWECDEIEED